MTAASSVQAGVVGLGMMGAGIATALADHGLLAAVHDVRAEAVDALPAAAGRAVGSAAEVGAACDVVMVVVVDLAQVEEVLFGDGGLAAGPGDGPVVGLCSTLEADDVRSVAARAASRGVTVVDVGISGGPDAAATGELVTTVGGSAEAFDRARPVLDAMSTLVVHAGAVGSGMELKLVKNAMSFMTLCAVHEALLLGEELGFSAEQVREVADRTNLVDQFFWFPMSRASARPVGAGDDDPTRAVRRHFAALARKDVGAAIALADGIGLAHPAMDVARAQADRYFLLPEG
jgi:3-hydroxyisobutyrate dehydrogenase